LSGVDDERGLAALMGRFPRSGRVEWIGLRPAHRADMVVVEAAEAVAGQGLAGDRYGSPGGKRQVSLIQFEHLLAVAAMVGRERVDPALVRRNVVVSGINLSALRDRDFCIGGVVLRGTGPCHPCSRMEEALGPGGYNAMRGHGGIVATVVQGGEIRVGDDVRG